jgi:ubiquinone/menaquinone biosynthesis C-methylase UbiE
MDPVETHYARGNIGPRIREALARAGKDVAILDPDDIEEMDTIHNRGREATVELACLVGFAAGMHVLDLGCGLGGPSRYIARQFGCRVTGIDLTQEYCEVAALLAERTGLSVRVDYKCVSALHTPFPDRSFDAVWTEHAAMNIEDKRTLYREAMRVLKPGGKFALYDVVKGSGGPIDYPVPWAKDASISFVVTPGALQAYVEEAGFRVLTWIDATPAVLAWADRMRAQAARAGEAGRVIQPGREIIGIDTSKMMKNHREGRTGLVMAVMQRPA